MNMLPVSPMKIFAGAKLYRRKPMQAPQKIMRNDAIIGDPPEIMIQIASRNDEILAKPAAIPSRPSIRLNALIIRIHQMTVNGSPM